VTLRFFDELPPRAIAQRLSVPRDVVRQRLHRGLAMLRSRLDQDFGDRRAWLGAFAALETGAGPIACVTLTLLAMNKLALVVTALVVVGAFLWWPTASTPPVQPGRGIESGTPSATVSGMVTGGDATLPRMPVQTPGDSAPPDCSLWLVDDRGTPIEDATIHLWSGERLEPPRRTDAHGHCTFSPSGSPWQVLVCAEGHFPWRTQLAERRGEHRFELPADQEIRGMLVVDGAPPRRPWPLSLDGALVPAELPDALAGVLAFQRLPTARTGPDGTFRFRGVPEGWRGALRLPGSLWLLPESGGTTDQHATVAVTAGTTNLYLATTQLPSLTCRMLWDDDGTRIPGVDATAIVWFVGEGTSPAFGTTSDDRGEIAVALRGASPSHYPIWCNPSTRPAVERVVLDVRGAGVAGRHEFEYTAQQIASGDVQVVRLPRARLTHFLAIDEAGAPIAGARVHSDGFSEPTGPDGRGTFAGTARDVRAVGAPHRRVGPCARGGVTAGTAEDPLVFVVPATNLVRLRVRGDDDAPAPFVEVEMHSDEEPFWTGGLASWFARELGHPAQGGQAEAVPQPDGTVRHRDCVNLIELEDGAADVWSLVPGRTLTFVVFDGMRRELARAPCVAPPDGARIELDLRVPGRARSWRGRVLDATGAPVPAASIRCSDPTDERGYGAGAKSDADGAFTVTGIWSRNPLRVRIEAPGFVVHQQDVPPLDGDQPTHPFVLERGLVVTVRVVDQDGAPVAIHARLDEAARLHDAHEDLGPGARRWRRLPPQPQTFHATLGGVDFAVLHDPRQPEAVLRVPKPGRLVVVAANGWPELPERTNLVARIDRLDANAPTFELWSPEPHEESLLVPGRYRIAVVAVDSAAPEGAVRERALGLSTEVDVAAGSLTRAEVR